MAQFTKNIDINVLNRTWTSGRPPLALLTHGGRQAADVSCSLMFAAFWTRPPVCYGFSLSDCWAWFRYFPAICQSPELRLREEWTSLDPHQKTILSEDLGVGFVTWFLSQTLGFIKYSDTRWVLKAAMPGAFALGASAKKYGPKKSPDYVAEDGFGRFSVVECKGTQTSRKSLQDAIKRGVPQKKNLKSLGKRLKHSLVGGLFVPQFESTEYPTLAIADPDRPEIWERLAELTPNQLARSVSQVAYAKELAMFDLSHTANAIMREKGSAESVSRAFGLDSDSFHAERAIDDEVRMRREYILREPARLSDDLLVTGIRFEGVLSARETARLRGGSSPEELAESEREVTRRGKWDVQITDVVTALRSPLGTRFSLTFLVP